MNEQQGFMANLTQKDRFRHEPFHSINCTPNQWPETSQFIHFLPNGNRDCSLHQQVEMMTDDNYVIIYIIENVGLLVVMIWLELCTTYRSSSPVVTTNSIILCFNKHRTWKIAVKTERDIIGNGAVCWMLNLHLVHQRSLHIARSVSERAKRV